MTNKKSKRKTEFSIEDSIERLAQFAKWTETEAPKKMLNEGGAPSDELLAYCKSESLSLDWLFCGDVRGLIKSSRRYDPNLLSIETETPIVALFREWKIRWVEANEITPDGNVLDHLAERVWETQRKITSAPATNMVDLAAKIVASTCDGDHELTEESCPLIFKEIRDLVAPVAA